MLDRGRLLPHMQAVQDRMLSDYTPKKVDYGNEAGNDNFAALQPDVSDDSGTDDDPKPGTVHGPPMRHLCEAARPTAQDIVEAMEGIDGKIGCLEYDSTEYYDYKAEVLADRKLLETDHGQVLAYEAIIGRSAGRQERREAPADPNDKFQRLHKEFNRAQKALQVAEKSVQKKANLVELAKADLCSAQAQHSLAEENYFANKQAFTEASNALHTFQNPQPPAAKELTPEIQAYGLRLEQECAQLQTATKQLQASNTQFLQHTGTLEKHIQLFLKHATPDILQAAERDFVEEQRMLQAAANEQCATGIAIDAAPAAVQSDAKDDYATLVKKTMADLGAARTNQAKVLKDHTNSGVIKTGGMCKLNKQKHNGPQSQANRKAEVVVAGLGTLLARH